MASLERVQRNLKRYRASVLKAAVEGRLVPTEASLARAEGRSYEPASVLLERILVERRRRWEAAELEKMKVAGKVPKDDGWVWHRELPLCIHQNHVFRARLLTGDFLPEYLSFYGNSNGQSYFIEQGKQTTNLASINLTKLRGLPVPIPPVIEQRPIVQEVEELLSTSQYSSSAIERSSARCRRLRQSILKWAFEGKLADQDPNDEPASRLIERIRVEREALQAAERTTPPQKRGRRRATGATKKAADSESSTAK